MSSRRLVFSGKQDNRYANEYVLFSVIEVKVCAIVLDCKWEKEEEMDSSQWSAQVRLLRGSRIGRSPTFQKQEKVFWVFLHLSFPTHCQPHIQCCIFCFTYFLVSFFPKKHCSFPTKCICHHILCIIFNLFQWWSMFSLLC